LRHRPDLTHTDHRDPVQVETIVQVLAAADTMTAQCSLHQLDMYEDVHDDTPMGRLLCPEPGCTSVLATETLAATRDQAWCDANGMLAPGWKTLGG
jgi:hypothetical protein